MVAWTAADWGNPGFQGDFAFDTIDCLGFCPLSDRSKGCLPLGLTKKVKLLAMQLRHWRFSNWLYFPSILSRQTLFYLIQLIVQGLTFYLLLSVVFPTDNCLPLDLVIHLLVRGMLYLLLGILLPWLVCKVFLTKSWGELIFWNRFGDCGSFGLFGKFTVHDFFVLPYFLE